MDKLISIAVAAYNVDKYIDILLKSLTHTKCISSMDIMVIDDGGSDNTMSIASKYAEDYPESIRLIHTENGGHGNVINTGIKNAVGEYFKVIDGDDHVDPDGLDELLNLISKYKPDIFLNPYIVFDDVSGEKISEEDSCANVTHDMILSVKDYHSDLFPQMHSLTVKTKLLRDNDVSITRHMFYVDVEYAFKASINADTVYAGSRPVYCYRVGRSGQSVSPEQLKKNFSHREHLAYALLEETGKTDKGSIKREWAEEIAAPYIYKQYMICAWQKRISEGRRFSKIVRNEHRGIYDRIVRKKLILLEKTGFLISYLWKFIDHEPV